MRYTMFTQLQTQLSNRQTKNKKLNKYFVNYSALSVTYNTYGK